jgi:hypothetical protein
MAPGGLAKHKAFETAKKYVYWGFLNVFKRLAD